MRALTLKNVRALEGHELHNAGRPENGNLRRKMSSSSRTKSKAAHDVLVWKGRTERIGKWRAQDTKDHWEYLGEKEKIPVWHKEDEAKQECQRGA